MTARLTSIRSWAEATAHDGPLGRGDLARSFAWAFGFFATLVLVSLALPGASPRSALAMMVCALLTYGLMLVLLVGDERLPRWIFPTLPLLGIAVVTAIVGWAGASVAPAYALLYFGVALAGFYSFSRGVAIATLCAVPVAYAVTLLARGLGVHTVVYWVMTTGVLTMTALLLIVLRRRVDATLGDLRAQASTDTLTGLLNRRGLEARLHEEVARAQRRGSSLTVAIADLDGFKQINDELGHPAGDAALRRFAQSLAANKRVFDTAGRLGGDEFAVVLPDTDPSGAVNALDRIRRQLHESFAEHDPPLRVSFGVSALCEAEPASAEYLLAAADRALYGAKAQGGDRVALSAGSPNGR